MDNEMILMRRPDFEGVMSDLIKKAVREVLQENTEAPTELDEYYSAKELAQKWKVSTQCIWRHVKLGHITPVHIGARVLFPKEMINKIGNLRYARKGDKKEQNIIA